MFKEWERPRDDQDGKVSRKMYDTRPVTEAEVRHAGPHAMFYFGFHPKSNKDDIKQGKCMIRLKF